MDETWPILPASSTTLNDRLGGPPPKSISRCSIRIAARRKHPRAEQRCLGGILANGTKAHRRFGAIFRSRRHRNRAPLLPAHRWRHGMAELIKSVAQWPTPPALAAFPSCEAADLSVFSMPSHESASIPARSRFSGPKRHPRDRCG